MLYTILQPIKQAGFSLHCYKCVGVPAVCACQVRVRVTCLLRILALLMHLCQCSQEEAQAQVASGQPFTLTVRAPWADKQVELPELTEEQKAYIQQQAEKKEAAATAEEVEAKGPTSFFHGKEGEDYQVGVGLGVGLC